MQCPPIYWHTVCWGSVTYGRLGDGDGRNFVVIGTCVGEKEGLHSVRITRNEHADLWGYAGSVEQAKRHVERWARRHWRTVG